MALSPDLQFRPGFPEAFAGDAPSRVKALTDLALQRTRIAFMVATEADSHEGVSGLLMDVENLIEVSQAASSGEEIEIDIADYDESFRSLHAHAQVLFNAINAVNNREGVGQDGKALEEIARGLLKALEELAANEQKDSDESWRAMLARRKAENEESQAFSKRWGLVAGSVEGRLDDEDVATLVGRLTMDPKSVLAAIRGEEGGDEDEGDD